MNGINSDSRLAGRIAIITGASSGLGAATARRFAASGARIICADLKPSPINDEIQQNYGKDRSIFVNCNVSSEEDIKAMIEHAVTWAGRLDIICTYAGIATETAHGLGRRIHETDTADFDRTMSINTRGLWLCCKYAIQQMMKQEPLPPNARGERTRGWIVNAASMLGLVGLKGGPCYVPSKHAVIGLTKQIGIDYAEDRIHCNALCPGFVRSPMTAALASTPEAEVELGNVHPWKALGRPEDVADAALFLASPESSWITGTAMVIDGGYTAQ